MKTIILCLALALFSGVALSYRNCPDARKHLYEALSVRQQMTNTKTIRQAWPGMDQHIAGLEVDLNICENRTKPEMEFCELARRKAEKAREAIMISLFRGTHYKSRDEAEKNYITINQENMAKFRREAAVKCPAEEICKDAKSSFQSSWSTLRGWRGVKDSDPQMIYGLELEVQTYRHIIISVCPAEDVCQFLESEKNRTTEAISYELSQSNYKAVQVLGVSYRNVTDVMILTCNAEQVCPHVEEEIKSAEENMKSIVRSVNPCERVMEESHSYISKLKKVHSEKCGGSKVRLAEIAGRFLSKLMKH